MKCAWLCMIVLLISGVARGQESGKASGGSANTDQALESRFQEYAAALKKHDTATLDKIWADDYLFINPRGELLTKAQRMENAKTHATSFEDIVLQREQLHVKGNTAIDIGRVDLKGTKYSGKEASGEYRYMNVWTHEGGQWKLLANQVTLIKK